MTTNDPQSALRRWGLHMGQPAVVVTLAGLSAILALIGPFGTDRVLGLVPRFGYWAVLVAASYVIGYWASAVLKPVLPTRGAVIWIGLVIGLGVSVFVVALNYAVFSFLPDPGDLPRFVATVVAISMIITFVFDVADRQTRSVPPDDEAPPAPLLDRLPLEKRGPLVALSVEDHYVRVRTTKGEEMVLMRLTDAIREVGATAGLQVHRSHWVALDAVRSARREGDRAILTMSHGGDIPVSRSRLADAKSARLLPR
ncbi:hypothetical protein GTA62_01755 [Roseobacter sp. HKCCD9010]|uniref:LytTR family DNA-binding domain-containing protein n=1 Tax=unclassified Roseobacter TaxID=196798 RepID=UPI001492EAE9|nr:hypothetical protein [Rhodobacterales bacterium HKCCD4356]NNV11411.1 hypothetical protein [Roseobacter sp. HKCCD7357]NNV15595.1 hypothetical protein [Roseobacter sp. HKCCD8768]NNV25055.1 hypothetical protein [Roseobacter sp. HKCCD8192]NNV29312.1 hypothetical protein [Roseobacter sp. HKCCD9061]NNV33585.1 hypothetical protein [Roseobacter sp. HKCCD9073]NNV37835.1 hypothetical protein [Roseobacter sp. HKCCD9054]NNV41792.1 hypothetical protein [Roseobacter sp. HKCCD6497]NNV46046.1 hypothetic